MRFPEIVLRLPDWVEKFLSEREYVFATVQERMRLVIELSQLNIKYKTGGPFGAAIFDGGLVQLFGSSRRNSVNRYRTASTRTVRLRKRRYAGL